MRVSVVDFSGSKVYYPYVASIVGKKHGNQTYYYLVTSARVDGKPRIVQQQYLGTSEEVTARLSGDQAGMPERVQHKGFGDLAAVWTTLSRLQVAATIDQAVGARRSDAATSVGTYLVPTDVAASERRAPTAWSIVAATWSRLRVVQTAARSPNPLCCTRSGIPAWSPDRRAVTSSLVPRYCCWTIRGLPSTRAEVTR